MSDKNWLKDLKEAIQSPPELRSVFTEVNIGQGFGNTDRSILYPRQLEASKDIVNNFKDDNLLATLEQEEQVLTRYGLENNELTLFFLAQKYGWRTTPLTKQGIGVSWFDHLKIGQALRSGTSGQGYLLLKGDLTGIQEYIYGNISKNTAGGLTKLAKRLRGRSAIVSLLTDFLANIFLKELNLPAWNLLFAGGGHFNLLLSNNEETHKKIATISAEFDREMQRMFAGKLQLVIAHVECGADIEQNAGYYFELLDTAKNKQKYKPFQSDLISQFYHKSDSIIGEAERKKRDDRMEMFGQKFPRAAYIIETQSNKNIQSHKNISKALGCKIGSIFYGLFTSNEQNAVKEIVGDPNFIAAQVYALNSTNFLPQESDWEKNISFGFRFIGKHVPTTKEDERPKNFEEIATPEGDQISMINAMRLDVDDLGCIFSKGLGDNASLASISALSREMHYFFSAYFDALAREKDMYVIYSGGDDAFVVGKWDTTIWFAIELEADFKKFTCNNPNLHFSAGIFMGKPHYPVGKFYSDAGRLQDEAKANSPIKGQVKAFNHALKWSSFGNKISFGKEIAEILKCGDPKDKKRFTMSFIFRLLQIVKTSFYDKDGKDPKGNTIREGGINTKNFARNSANLRYLFARNGFKDKEIEKVQESIQKQLVTNFLSNFDVNKSQDTKKEVRDYLVALNYALFNIRSVKSTK
jgi:CRISPR-associated protein Csm1